MDKPDQPEPDNSQPHSSAPDSAVTPTQPFAIDRRAVRDGLRVIGPLLIPIPPLGFVLGVLIAESTIDKVAGWASSWLLFAGSSQFAAILVLDGGGGVLIGTLTIAIVNARHLVYSAAMQERFRGMPGWFKVVGPYLLMDELLVITEARPDSDSRNYRMTHFLTVGLTVWVLFNVSITAGVVAGNAIPSNWSLDFAVPMAFLGLLIMSIRDRPGLLAALVGGVVAVIARGLPNGSGLLVGALAGMAAAALVDGDTT